MTLARASSAKINTWVNLTGDLVIYGRCFLLHTIMVIWAEAVRNYLSSFRKTSWLFLLVRWKWTEKEFFRTVPMIAS